MNVTSIQTSSNHGKWNFLRIKTLFQSINNYIFLLRTTYKAIFMKWISFS